MYTPDGAFVVFEGNSIEAPGRNQLFRASVDGSVPPMPVGPTYSYTVRRGT